MVAIKDGIPLLIRAAEWGTEAGVTYSHFHNVNGG